MAVEPNGVLSEPVWKLVTTLSECETFQTLVGANSAEEALASIYVVSPSNVETELTRPLAIINRAPGWNWNFMKGVTGGHLYLMFEVDVNPEYSQSWIDAYFDFSNTIGAILEDLRAATYDTDALFVKDITESHVIERSAYAETTDYFSVAFLLEYGVR